MDGHNTVAPTMPGRGDGSPPQKPAEPDRSRRPGSRWRGERGRRWLLALAVVGLLTQLAFAMVSTAVAQTPTIDEPVYVGAAVAYQQERTFRFNPEHPPLGKLIIGVGLALTPVRMEPGFDGTQAALGRRLLYRSSEDPQLLLLAARAPVMALTLLLGLVVFGFARDLVGPAAAVAALALYTFSPDVIAHGSLATLDVPAAGFLLTTCWLLWRARRRPLPYLPLAAVALGAAVATKMSALAAVPVVLLLAVAALRQATRVRGEPPHPTVGRLGPVTAKASTRIMARAGVAVAVVAGMAVVATAVVWVSYLLVDPALRWEPPPDLPAAAGLRGHAVDWLPFPQPYKDGLRMQFDLENAGFGGYLFGEAYSGSRWYYLPAALLVKAPLGALALWLAGAATLLARPRLRPAAGWLLLPAAVLLAAAMTGSRDLGVRYAIAVPVFLAVAAAAVFTWRRRWVRVAALVLLLFVAASSVRAYPYYLPYGNEAFGGPAQTARHLHDSNVDWGQDLGRLAELLHQRYPDQPVWLVYKGSGLPSHYGILAADPLKVDPEQVRGLLVVSDSAAARANDRLAGLIGSSEPIDRVGHSITIYRR